MIDTLLQLAGLTALLFVLMLCIVMIMGHVVTWAILRFEQYREARR